MEITLLHIIFNHLAFVQSNLQYVLMQRVPAKKKKKKCRVAHQKSSTWLSFCHYAMQRHPASAALASQIRPSIHFRLNLRLILLQTSLQLFGI